MQNYTQYTELYRQSLENPEGFWKEKATCIDWMKPFTKVKETSFDPDNFYIRWFEDGTLNASANCLDRHLQKYGETTALLWEGNDPNESCALTYKELYEQVCKFSNCLKSLGIQKGDRVSIYLPMIPEAVIAMLSCARIGAIHSVVFGGFSPESLANRIQDCEAKLVITANEALRGVKKIPLKQNTDLALLSEGTATVEKVIVVQRTLESTPWNSTRDVWYHEIMAKASLECPPVELSAEDPLFILYTSGSTGKPKGVLHTTGGYLVYASLTHRYVFDYNPGEIYWCTADVGWITGHTYGMYGPLSNAATILLFEGILDYPNSSRCWEIIDKWKVTIFYTAPTAIRALMRLGDAPVKRTSRQSLRLLGTVGEPINPEAWEWYHTIVGEKRCPIVDTWWQTETGGILLTPLPSTPKLKPGCVTKPFFGIRPGIIDERGNLLKGEASGILVFCDSWPGIMRSLYNDHKRFIDTYFRPYPGLYFTGDGAKRDQDGDYWISGRVDDVINVSGHRIGTAEVESALDSHPKVVETAVVGFPHALKGQGIYAFITLKLGETPTEELKKELSIWIGHKIGAIAKPDLIQWASALPKTRSGKIMRRILRKIAEKEDHNIGDTSTLADPSVVDDLIQNRPES